MAKEYRVTNQQRFANRLIKLGIRLGIIPRPAYVMTVRGRKSGKPHSLPVSLIEEENGRWLVAPYGEVNWVKNARVAGEVTLSRGGHEETGKIEEIPVDQRAPILKTYFDREGFARRYTDFTRDTPIETYAQAAGDYPVFRLV